RHLKLDAPERVGPTAEHRDAELAEQAGGDSLGLQPAARQLRLHRHAEPGHRHELFHDNSLSRISPHGPDPPRTTNRSPVRNVSTTSPVRWLRTVTAPCGQVPR